tara:strand:+ start:440 stop:607 length:168 start_codon:yes stop_codon:yes gene_type:complete
VKVDDDGLAIADENQKNHILELGFITNEFLPHKKPNHSNYHSCNRSYDGKVIDRR